MTVTSVSEWYVDLRAPVRIASSFAYVRKRFFGDGPVLDVGCGTGEYLALFPPGSVGVELSAPNHRACSERGLKTVYGDLNHPLPFASGSFENVFISHVLEHVESPIALLREARRIARRRVVLALPLETGAVRLLLRDHYFRGHPTHLYSFSFPCIERLFEVAGLRVEARILDFPLVRYVAPTWGTRVLNQLPHSLMRRVAGNFWTVGALPGEAD